MKDYKYKPSDFWAIVEHGEKFRPCFRKSKKRKKTWKKSKPVELMFSVEVKTHSDQRMIILPKFKILKGGK